MPTPTNEPSINIPPPPSFSDFKFSVIGQPPQLLTRMGATPPPDFRHSPTPLHMELGYPSRNGTPRMLGQPSQSSLQQRLSTDHSTSTDLKGLYIPMDLSEEQKPDIKSDTPITGPLQSLQSSDRGSVPISTTRHTSLHSPPDLSGLHSIPTSIAVQCSTLTTVSSPSLPLQTSLTPGSSSSGASETHNLSKSSFLQIQSDMEFYYESALMTFEKAERGLKLAQETYDAAKATLTAMTRARFPRPAALAADAYEQQTNKVDVSGSLTLDDQLMTDPDGPIITEISGRVPRTASPSFQKQSIQRKDHPAQHFSAIKLPVEQRDLSRGMTELEREADDARLAWSLSSAHQFPLTLTPTPEANEPPISPFIRSLLETSAGSSTVPQSSKAGLVVNSTTIIAKDEDPTDSDDYRRLHVQTPIQASSSEITRGIDSVSTSSQIPIDHDTDRITFAPVPASSRMVKNAELNRATTVTLQTGIQCIASIDDPDGQHAKAPDSAPRGSSANPIDLENTAEDENLTDSDHTRSESNPISLGEDVSNELEVERELEREDSVPYSPSTNTSDSLQPIETPNDTVDGEVPRDKLSPISKAGQDIKGNSTPPQGSISELHKSSAFPPASSQGDHSPNNANSLLERLQSPQIGSSSEISEPQSKSVTVSSSSSPSVLGKRRHLDPPSSRPSPILPFKRRHLTITEPNDSPSLESRISEASVHTSESDQPSTYASSAPRRAGHTSQNYKNNTQPRSNLMHPAERPMSPPSGPRATRQEGVYSKHTSAAPSRLPLNDYWPPAESDSYRFDRFKSKGPRNKYGQDSQGPTSGYDRSSGAGRGGKRLGQHRVAHSQEWSRRSTADNAGPSKSDMRAPHPPSERRAHEPMSLADRLRDPWV